MWGPNMTSLGRNDQDNETLGTDAKEWFCEGFLCIFKVLLQPDNDEGRASSPLPQLHRALSLDKSLIKAITSAKLSPTGRFALVGYGVRNDNNEVEDHPHKHVATELLNIRNMTCIGLMESETDEVNIAQFHPDSGKGLMYGTKKGRVRKFVKKVSPFEMAAV